MKQINQNITQILRDYQRIAVVGLSPDPFRSSNGVARRMLQFGYEVIPVNPLHDELLERKAYASLLDIPGAVDLVNVFRRPEYVDGIVEEAIAIGAKAIWLQLGVINQPAAEKALAAGLDVVMDRCWAMEYR